MVMKMVTTDIIVTCEYGYPYEWEKIGSAYTCSTKNFNSTLPNENVTSVVGTHDVGKTNDDVRKLNIYRQICEFLPRGFEKIFPNLEGVRVAQSGLVSLTQFDLRVYPKLRSCDMFNNRLRTLDADLFAESPLVEYLYFGDNSLYRIGYDIFVPLKSLSKAIFQGNNCIRKNAETAADVPDLQKAVNTYCSPPDSRVTVREQKIRKLEEQRKNDALKIKQLQEEDARLEAIIQKNGENSSSSSTFWMIFVFILFLLTAVAAALYLIRFRGIQINKAEDTESFFQASIEREEETMQPYENGGTNLSFEPFQQTPNVMK